MEKHNFSWEQREKVRSGFGSQLRPYILNKTWFFSCDRILNQAIYVQGFSTSQNRVAPISHCVRPKRFQRVGNAVKQSNGKVQMSLLLPCGKAKGEHSAILKDASALSEAMPLAYSYREPKCRYQELSYEY